MLDLRSGGLDPLRHARATSPVVLELPGKAERPGPIRDEAGYGEAPLRHDFAQRALIDRTLVVPDDATTEIGHAIGSGAGLDH